MTLSGDFIIVSVSECSGRCGICLDDFTETPDNPVVSHSPQKGTHKVTCFFHEQCLKEWVKRSPVCPFDRTKITSINGIPTPDAEKGVFIEEENFPQGAGDRLFLIMWRLTHDSEWRQFFSDMGVITVLGGLSIAAVFGMTSALRRI